MLIGVDASRATSAQRTGIENYSYHLIRELLSLSSPHQFRLYFNRPPAPGLFPPGAEERIIPFPRLWTHLRLSWEMGARAPDLLFVPSHVLPLVHPRRSVVTVHDLGYHYYPQAHTAFQNLYLRWSTRHNARAAVIVVADSEATRRDLIDVYGFRPDKIVVVYPGRDEAFVPVRDSRLLDATRARYGLSGSYLLYVGTLHPRKNLVRLVQAFGQVLGRLDPSLCLVLAGQKGWLYDEIAKEIERWDLSGRVVLPGYVPAQDLPALLSGALAFLFPSLYEGFGFPVLEAMACGTPVICSNTSSLPEVAGEAACLVNPLDTAELAQAIYAVCTGEEVRRAMAQRGLEQAQHFDWTRCAGEIMHVLAEAGRGLA